VAIVQPGHGRQTTPAGWIAAVLNDEPHNDAVVERTMGEARPRKAPVLLVDRREDSWAETCSSSAPPLGRRQRAGLNSVASG